MRDDDRESGRLFRTRLLFVNLNCSDKNQLVELTSSCSDNIFVFASQKKQKHVQRSFVFGTIKLTSSWMTWEVRDQECSIVVVLLHGICFNILISSGQYESVSTSRIPPGRKRSAGHRGILDWFKFSGYTVKIASKFFFFLHCTEPPLSEHKSSMTHSGKQQ